MDGKNWTKWVNILIDIGSTHNFLKPAMLEKVKLPLNLTEKVRVGLSSVDINPIEGSARGQFKIPGTTFTMEVHVLVLEGCDLVLKM